MPSIKISMKECCPMRWRVLHFLWNIKHPSLLYLHDGEGKIVGWELYRNLSESWSSSKGTMQLRSSRYRTYITCLVVKRLLSTVTRKAAAKSYRDVLSSGASNPGPTAVPAAGHLHFPATLSTSVQLRVAKIQLMKVLQLFLKKRKTFSFWFPVCQPLNTSRTPRLELEHQYHLLIDRKVEKNIFSFRDSRLR
jgi:hypothetical protein